jgi:hypothetical protein
LSMIPHLTLEMKVGPSSLVTPNIGSSQSAAFTIGERPTTG